MIEWAWKGEREPLNGAAGMSDWGVRLSCGLKSPVL